MHSRFLLLLGVTAVLLSQVYSAHLGRKKRSCLASKGVDVCSCGSTVVRPPLAQKLPLITSSILLNKLNPVQQQNSMEDIYPYEEEYYVEQVPSPKKSCSSCQKKQETYYMNPSNLPSLRESFDTYDSVNYGEDNYRNRKPVDTVSTNLAYELARRAGTAAKEESLNFGPRTLPKDGAIVKIRKDIPEDRLYSFDTQVVDLKYPSTKNGNVWAEELVIAPQENGFGAQNKYNGPTNYFSFSELGYVPENSKKAFGSYYEDDRDYRNRPVIYGRLQDSIYDRQGVVDENLYGERVGYGSDERREVSYPRERKGRKNLQNVQKV